MNSELLRTIFLDAHVLDLDFAEWDRGVKLLVVAEELPPDGRNRLPLFILDFQRVHDLAIKFSHLAHPIQNGHYQWRVHDMKLGQRNGLWNIQLSGSKSFPVLEMTFESVDIRTVDHEALSRVAPGWKQPGGPLVRAGIEAMISRMGHSKRKN